MGSSHSTQKKIQNIDDVKEIFEVSEKSLENGSISDTIKSNDLNMTEMPINYKSSNDSDTIGNLNITEDIENDMRENKKKNMFNGGKKDKEDHEENEEHLDKKKMKNM